VGGVTQKGVGKAIANTTRATGRIIEKGRIKQKKEKLSNPKPTLPASRTVVVVVVVVIVVVVLNQIQVARKYIIYNVRGGFFFGFWFFLLLFVCTAVFSKLEAIQLGEDLRHGYASVCCRRWWCIHVRSCRGCRLNILQLQLKLVLELQMLLGIGPPRLLKRKLVLK
jgi:hypothetical protein